jgi:nucleoside-diphosphate-sugar epimerase
MDNKNTKVIVTGGAGFIGSNLVDGLVEEGFEVHVVDSLIAGKKENVNSKAVLHVVDIRDLDSLIKIFDSAKYVFHLAALPRVQYSIEHPVETNEVNVSGLLNVFVAAEKNKVKRIIYSASGSAYGDQEKMPLTEDMTPSFKSPYGLHKYIGELYASVFAEVYGIETVSLRYFNIYGPRQSGEGAYALVIARFLKQKMEGAPMTITGDGEQTRDFVHVKDAVRANLLAMKSDRVGKGEVVNIGAGKNISVNKIAELIGGEIEYIPARLEPRHSLADISKAKELLGWSPLIEIEEGIKEFL